MQKKINKKKFNYLDNTTLQVLFFSPFTCAVRSKICQSVIGNQLTFSAARLGFIIYSGLCVLRAYCPICLYWQWYWSRALISSPVPVKKEAFLLSLLHPSIISITPLAFSHHLYSRDIGSVNNNVLHISKARCLRWFHIICIALAGM